MKQSPNRIELIEKAILIRKVEEKLLDLYSKGKLNGTVHTCVGQEFTGVCISEFLERDDFVVSNHRGHGHYISRTNDIKGLLAEVMGKKSGAAGGIGGSQHLVSNNYISNGIQGGMTPIASGLALGYKMKGKLSITVAYIGDGTLGEGILYETFNLSSLWSCPVLFVLENNKYAQSTSFDQNFTGNVGDRIKAFNIKYFSANSWDLDQLLEISKTAVNFVRTESKPALVEIQTYRLNSHSKGDDNRDNQEVMEFRQKDFLEQFAVQDPITFQELQQRAVKVVEDSYNEIVDDEDLAFFNNENFIKNDITGEVSLNNESDKRINELIYSALKHEFAENPESIIIGEDIEYNNQYTPKPYGGAFKVTKDLNVLFPERVRNTPISEAAIVGFSTGLAISGFRAIAEIMFGDFSTLILDQLHQHACKFNRMFNGKVSVPLVVRTPMGGKRGYGPTHSQSIEKIFLGIPDLDVIAINHRIDPTLVYKSIFSKTQHPTLVIENKVLYTRILNEKKFEGFEFARTIEDFPTVIMRPINKKAELTIICYGGMLEEAESAVVHAFDENEILCEIIAPSRLCPLNIYPLAHSVGKTGKLLVIEEGSNFAAFGSEVVTALMETGVSIKKVSRLANNNIIPCSFIAENNILPNKDLIFKSIVNLCNE